MLKLNYAVASDVGLVRGNNEDSAYAGPYLLALADGMGGHAAGEVASQLMITHLERLDANPEDNDMAALLASVADDANTAIANKVTESPETDGMGTTLTALIFNGTEFEMCHVGDSRGYRLRDGKLEQITVDDTYVQSLVEKGELDPADVSTHPRRSLILKAYTGRPVEPTLKIIDAKVGDRILLCSDGLSDPVTAETIEQTLSKGTPEEAAYNLVELALRSGGPDNVTVVIADVVDGDSPDIELPTTPVTAGALNDGESTDPRPDTAARRAAQVINARQSQEIPATTADSVAEQDVDWSEIDTDVKEAAPRSHKKRWLALLIVVLLLALAVIGGTWCMKKTFFISTNTADNGTATVVIKQGLPYKIFGHPLNSTYQKACLDESGKQKTLPIDSTEPCSPLKLSDLKEDARSSVATLSAGSYDKILQQLDGLSNEALPLCVTRKTAPSSTASPEPTSPAKPTEGATPTTSPTASTKTATPPTTSNKPADLTEPGVTCREVSAHA